MSAESKRKWRIKNRLRDAYLNHKSNAKKRGKAFDLTFEQFKQFSYECEMVTSKGRIKKGMTIDRIINEGGYTIGNIQRMPGKMNSAKGVKSFIYDWQTKTAYYINLINYDNDNERNLPF